MQEEGLEAKTSEKMVGHSSRII